MSALDVQVENPSSEMHGTTSVSGLDIFQILEYLHIHNEIYWGWDLNLNTKFIYVSYILYTHNLKVILYKVFNSDSFFFLTKFHDVEFFTCPVTSPLRKFQILEHFELWLFELGRLNIYMVSARSILQAKEF
jgi:hypothetical protein